MTQDCCITLQLFNQLQELNKMLNSKFETCLGTSPTRIEILQQLYKVEEMSQSNLQKQLNIDHAAITRHLKQLETKNLISRRKKAEDNRVTLVCLTPVGREKITAAIQKKKEFMKQTFSNFSEEELEITLTTLTKISGNISTIQLEDWENEHVKQD